MKLHEIVSMLFRDPWTGGLLKIAVKYKIAYRTVIDRTPIPGEIENLSRSRHPGVPRRRNRRQ
jgi:hypothetical protein